MGKRKRLRIINNNTKNIIKISNIKVSPKKIMDGLKCIKNKNLLVVINILKFLNKKYNIIILKSIINFINNNNYVKSNLNNFYIYTIIVNLNKVLKRYKCVSHGRSNMIKKKYSNLKIIINKFK
ncbi:MAG: uL22 family ribosomal protein [Candidatus Shikimatogenerans sp. AspAUS03]|uniref:50S ribosomal protein L22 n=1 Tax=Candidatus Shikimatogenerans sp. AspAUS03 TaxID=3158563 RepID=A0AAU7QSF7_9FLAO